MKVSAIRAEVETLLRYSGRNTPLAHAMLTTLLDLLDRMDGDRRG